jgi:hypothetical protein
MTTHWGDYGAFGDAHEENEKSKTSLRAKSDL